MENIYINDLKKYIFGFWTADKSVDDVARHLWKLVVDQRTYIRKLNDERDDIIFQKELYKNNPGLLNDLVNDISNINVKIGEAKASLAKLENNHRLFLDDPKLYCPFKIDEE